MSARARIAAGEVSEQEIERALGLAAYIVARHGAVYAPIFDFLEAELVKARAEGGDPIARARRYLALHSVEGAVVKAIR